MRAAEQTLIERREESERLSRLSSIRSTKIAEPGSVRSMKRRFGL